MLQHAPVSFLCAHRYDSRVSLRSIWERVSFPLGYPTCPVQTSAVSILRAHCYDSRVLVFLSALFSERLPLRCSCSSLSIDLSLSSSGVISQAYLQVDDLYIALFFEPVFMSYKLVPSLLHRSIFLSHHLYTRNVVHCLYKRGGSGVLADLSTTLPVPGPLNEPTFTFRFPLPSTLSSSDCTSGSFPPPPLTQNHINKIINDWCADSDPALFEEAGCCVCGQLTPITQLSSIKHVKNHLHVLKSPGVTRLTRSDTCEPITEHTGPVLDLTCRDQICDSCRRSLREGKVPKLALSNGLWLGEVPDVLKGLTFYEKMLVARVRHTKCFVRVQKGAGTKHCKLISNVIAFENPTPKIYNVLPPPRKDIEEVLAILFSGSTKPTDEDYQ